MNDKGERSAIVSALKDADNGTIRVVYGSRWLLFERDRWIVYSQGYRQKLARLAIETDSELDAVRELLKGMG